MLLTRTLLGIPLAIWIQSTLGYEAFRAQVSMPGYSAPAAGLLWKWSEQNACCSLRGCLNEDRQESDNSFYLHLLPVEDTLAVAHLKLELEKESIWVDLIPLLDSSGFQGLFSPPSARWEVEVHCTLCSGCVYWPWSWQSSEALPHLQGEYFNHDHKRYVQAWNTTCTDTSTDWKKKGNILRKLYSWPKYWDLCWLLFSTFNQSHPEVCIMLLHIFI